jgi:hypothetical protein
VSLKDVAGVFSRYFIVGFFLPAFFVIMALARSLTSDFLPNIYEQYGEGTQVLIVGGAALLLGLLLLGLNYPIYRLLEGYPLLERIDRWYAAWLARPMRGMRQRAYRRLCGVRDSEDEDPDRRADAAWRLDRLFPSSETSVLPTRFGNAVRAFELHATNRWGLDAIGAWPRVELLMAESEAELQANAKSEVAFFINGSLLAGLGAITLLVDEGVNQPIAGLGALVYAIPFVVSYLLYRASVGAAVRWGSVVRATIDLHRLTLYQRLGVRQPITFSDERDVIAPAVNNLLVYGFPMPDDLRDPSPPADGGSTNE